MNLERCKVFDGGLLVIPVEGRHREERGDLVRDFQACGIGGQTPTVGIIPVIGTQNDAVTQKIVQPDANRQFVSFSRQLFNCRRTVLEIYPVKGQSKVSGLDDSVEHNQSLGPLVDDLGERQGSRSAYAGIGGNLGFTFATAAGRGYGSYLNKF